jgi:hypothetical protein
MASLAQRPCHSAVPRSSSRPARSQRVRRPCVVLRRCARRSPRGQAGFGSCWVSSGSCEGEPTKKRVPTPRVEQKRPRGERRATPTGVQGTGRGRERLASPPRQLQRAPRARLAHALRLEGVSLVPASPTPPAETDLPLAEPDLPLAEVEAAAEVGERVSTCGIELVGGSASTLEPGESGLGLGSSASISAAASTSVSSLWVIGRSRRLAFVSALGRTLRAQAVARLVDRPSAR